MTSGAFLCSKLLDQWACLHGMKLDFFGSGTSVEDFLRESFNGLLRAQDLDVHWCETLEWPKAEIEVGRLDYSDVQPTGLSASRRQRSSGINDRHGTEKMTRRFGLPEWTGIGEDVNKPGTGTKGGTDPGRAGSPTLREPATSRPDSLTKRIAVEARTDSYHADGERAGLHPSFFRPARDKRGSGVVLREPREYERSRHSGLRATGRGIERDCWIR